MRLGIPKESLPLEKRVAATPDSVKKLKDQGFEVLVERGAGEGAGYFDAAYEQSGATLVDGAEALGAPVVAKVRPPTLGEVERLAEGACLVSLVQPASNPGLVDALARRKITVVALEKVPRTTRAQKMDVLSSTAVVAGYRSVLEAAGLYQGFFGPQVTAAGSTPPGRVLIIGAGVAGLAALAAAKSLGAEVRAFDTRSAAREQVESLGGKFLEVEMKEAGEGGGGYAKVMSPEFIAAEMALFRAQAKEVDVIITTALVPGAKAPILVPKDVVECLKPGSVVVDMAAEQGGNCELTRPGEVVVHNGVRIVGHTDLASRMAATASRFFAANVANLLVEMGGGKGWKIDLANDIVRPSTLAHAGEVLPAPPPPEPSPPKAAPKPPPQHAKPAQANIQNPARNAWGTTLGSMLLIAVLFTLGRFAPADFLQHATVFVLACFVGWQVVWSVSPSLHTPLMSVTNAISGIIIVGGILQVDGTTSAASILGLVAALFASINIAGGFLVTQRMLKMFRREEGRS